MAAFPPKNYANSSGSWEDWSREYTKKSPRSLTGNKIWEGKFWVFTENPQFKIYNKQQKRQCLFQQNYMHVLKCHTFALTLFLKKIYTVIASSFFRKACSTRFTTFFHSYGLFYVCISFLCTYLFFL